MTKAKTLAIIGAGGSVGRAAVRIAQEGGHPVIAIDRDDLDLGFDGVEHRCADVLSDDLAPVLKGADAVISCLGLPLNPMTSRNPPPLYTDRTTRIVDAMRTLGQTRLVVISATFAERSAGPLWFRAVSKLALGKIFAQMHEMEEILCASDGIDWTAVRPCWLLDEPESGDTVVTKSTVPAGFLRTRIPDLARFLVQTAVSEDWIRQSPAIATDEGLQHTLPHALIRDVA